MWNCPSPSRRTSSASAAAEPPADEIHLANTLASFEPALDYVVTKMPRFPFDKFTDANNSLSTQMKATGEVMSVGRTIEESLLKAVRSLEIGAYHLHIAKFDDMSTEDLCEYIKIGTDDRIFALAELLRRSISVEELNSLTKIDLLFLRKIRNIGEIERELKANNGSVDYLKYAKKNGFSDIEIAYLWDMAPREIFELRKKHGIMPTYKMIDTCASEFKS